ncbi:hypothetical protein [Candidatus Epulonipiscium viviparus]|uniref:hypothetical protein n=1 Tax=Candidatus Epulonipiscium viviparus TaxID=420336 RepID=UPI0027381665|nr:hypothetical protein [Candidatus Epulopiscium viviparus]
MKLSKKIFALTLAGSLTLGAVSIYGDTTKAVNVINEETDSDAVEIEVEIEVEDATDDVVVIAAPKKASALDEEAIVILEDIAVVIENTDATAEDAVVVAPENTDAQLKTQ